MEYYYIEKDGMVYLIEKEGVLTFPSSLEDIGFEVGEKTKMPLNNATVYYCHPKIDSHPEHWYHKDKIFEMENIDKLVLNAVNKSLVRHGSNAILIKDNKVLMVKANRGLAKDMWILPGGFISYGEHPIASLKREVKEETGFDIEVKEFIDADTEIFEGSELYMMILTYLCEVAGGSLKPDPDEIGEAKYFDIEDAIKITGSPFTKKALKIYKDNYQ
jgi:ADP-ribose pyrophosphatase YjhB (NUDIX family)